MLHNRVATWFRNAIKNVAKAKYYSLHLLVVSHACTCTVQFTLHITDATSQLEYVQKTCSFILRNTIDWHNIEHNRAWLEASEHNIIGRTKSIKLINFREFGA